jgi:hypothetical protein
MNKLGRKLDESLLNEPLRTYLCRSLDSSLYDSLDDSLGKSLYWSLDKSLYESLDDYERNIRKGFNE